MFQVCGTAPLPSLLPKAPGEWRLHLEVVGMIWARYGRAVVDLFASEETTHFLLWFSLDFLPLGQDALAHAWPDSLLNAFPPIPLLLATLGRVQHCSHRLLLVATHWLGRQWFPMLLRLLKGVPWCLPERLDLVSQVGGRIWHPNLGCLQLCVWPLKAKTHPCHPVTSQWSIHS